MATAPELTPASAPTSPELLAMINDVPLSTQLLNLEAVQLDHMNDMISDVKQVSKERARHKRLEADSRAHLNIRAAQTVEEMERDYNEVSKDEDPATSPSEERKKKEAKRKTLQAPVPTEPQESDAMKIYEMTKKNPVTRNLFMWLRVLKLKKFRAERIRNDLANGYVVAEVLSR